MTSAKQLWRTYNTNPWPLSTRCAKNALHSLEALDIGSQDRNLSSENDDEGFPESLSRFTKLKTIRLEDVLFLDIDNLEIVETLSEK